VLFGKHREQLAEAGVAYPSGWQREGRDREMGVVNQNGLTELLERPGADRAATMDAIREFEEYVREQDEDTLLLSSEELITWRASEGSREPLSTLLATFRGLGGVSLVVTVRRVDELLSRFGR